MKSDRFTALRDPGRRSFTLALAATVCAPLASCGGGGGGGDASDGKALFGMVMEPPSAAAAIGATAFLSLTAFYRDDTKEDVTLKARWTSSDPAVATVFAGRVTGVATGSVLITGEFGGDSRSVRVDIGAAWRAAGELLTASAGTEAVALRDGRVLVMGRSFVYTEVFDPATRRSVAAQSWRQPRQGRTATLLADGRVLVTGGYDFNAGASLASAILFDPVGLTWSDAANMAVARASHTATLLQDGRVLVVGGTGSGAATEEIYDPASDTWAPVARLAKPRSLHTATLLQDGRVMVFGGLDGGDGVSFSSSFAPTNRVELFDPRTGAWTAGTPLPRGGRYAHTATLLPNGRVLVAGGSPYNDAPYQYLGTAELYDPVAGAWTATGSMIEPRFGHQAILLPNGRVMVAAGSTWSDYIPPPPEVFDLAKGTWSAVPLMQPRTAFPIVALANGTALALGGRKGSADLASVEAYP